VTPAVLAFRHEASMMVISSPPGEALKNQELDEDAGTCHFVTFANRARLP
jgi:hypothetical protein